MRPADDMTDADVTADVGSEGGSITESGRRVFLPHLQPTRGAQRLLESLRDDRKSLFVARSAEEDEVQDLLKVGCRLSSAACRSAPRSG